MPLILKQVSDVLFREVGNLFIASFNRPSFDEGKGLNFPCVKILTSDL